MAFYSEGEIHTLVPLILHVHDDVAMQRDGHAEIGELVSRLLDDGVREEGATNKVFILSPPNDPQTVRLEAPIPNDITAQTGRNWAFVMSQRYMSLESLQKAHKTSDLVSD